MADEVVDHIGMYESMVAEGFSAFNFGLVHFTFT